MIHIVPPTIGTSICGDYLSATICPKNEYADEFFSRTSGLACATSRIEVYSSTETLIGDGLCQRIEGLFGDTLFVGGGAAASLLIILLEVATLDGRCRRIELLVRRFGAGSEAPGEGGPRAAVLLGVRGWNGEQPCSGEECRHGGGRNNCRIIVSCFSELPSNIAEWRHDDSWTGGRNCVLGQAVPTDRATVACRTDMSARVVTVFGGTGFLGRRIVRHLREHELSVRIASRHPDRSRQLFGSDDPDLQSVETDIHDRQAVVDALAGSRGVVNAVSLYVEHGGQTFHSVHVEAARRVASEARRAGVERLVHLSGIGADPTSRSLYIRKRGEGELAVRAAFADALSSARR